MVDSNSSINRNQSDIRIDCKKLRAQIDPQDRLHLSAKICDEIIRSDAFQEAENIGVFVPMKTEVDVWPLINCAWRLKKRIFAPITQENFSLAFSNLSDESELSTTEMGLKEPIGGNLMPADQLDLVLVPLVAFDVQNNRVGMGGGYYDRTFSFLQQSPDNSKPKLIGVAFECQRVARITPNPWDIRLLSVITESG